MRFLLCTISKCSTDFPFILISQKHQKIGFNLLLLIFYQLVTLIFFTSVSVIVDSIVIYPCPGFYQSSYSVCSQQWWQGEQLCFARKTQKPKITITGARLLLSKIKHSISWKSKTYYKPDEWMVLVCQGN